MLADITDEVERERKHLWQTEKYEILSESADMITFDYTPGDDVMRISVPRPDGGVREEVRQRYLESARSYAQVPREERDRFVETLREAARTAMRGTYDFEGNYYGTGMRWYRAKYVSLADEEGAVYRVVGRLDDINDIIRKQDQLRVDAQMDEITGVYNKNYAIAAIAEALRAKRLESYDALLFLDGDSFKTINDTFGHLEADEVLRQIGAILRGLFRKGDIVARFGGDEFIIYMRSAGELARVTAKAGAILRAVNRIKVKGKNPVQCSIGVTSVIGEGDTYDGALRRADMALYQAKGKGKNRYVVLERTKREHD